MSWRIIPRFIHRLAMGLASRSRNLGYRMLGVNLRGYVWLRRVSIPRQWSCITLEPGASLDDGVVLLSSGAEVHDKLVIGSGSYVNRYTMFDAHVRLHVGRRVMIGPHCYFTDANHGSDPGSSVQSQPMHHEPLIIEDEAWIGAHATVLPGVRVGRGAIVAAGAVVTHDVPAMSIVAGVPARVIRYRDGRPASEGEP